MGPDHRAQPHRRLPHDPARGAAHEARRNGAGSSAPPRPTASSPAPTSRPMSPPSTASPASPRRSRWRSATDGITVNCISPGYVWTPLVENQIPDTMKARGLTREQVMNDVLLAAQPTKQFVTRRAGRGARAVPVPRRGGLDHRRQPLDGRRLDRGVSAPHPGVIPAKAGTHEPKCRRACEKRRRSFVIIGVHGSRPSPG